MSASVLITALIEVETVAASAALVTTLSNSLATPAAASAALGITVESAPTIEAITVRTIVYAPPAPPPAAVSSGLSNGAIAGIIVGVTAVGIAIAFALYKKKSAFVTHQPSAKLGKPTPMDMRPMHAV